MEMDGPQEHCSTGPWRDRGYWLTEFLSISAVIQKAPAQYVRAYVFSEIDDNDVTYFLDYKLRVISRLDPPLARVLGAQNQRDEQIGGHAARF